MKSAAERSVFFWNVVSFGLTAISGLAINLALGYGQGTAAVGVFNQIYAAHILLGQAATLGVQWAVTREAAMVENEGRYAEIIGTALLVVGGGSILVAVATLVGVSMASGSAVAAGLAWVALALPFFAVNKVMISALNGMGLLHRFALARGCRPLFLLLGVGCCLAWPETPGTLGFPFLIAETGMSAVLGIMLRCELRLPSLVAFMARAPGYVWFGLRALPGNSLSEINTRIDVLVLGLFAGDAEVGVYSLAAMLVEGGVEVLAICRMMMQPKIPPALDEGRGGAVLSDWRRIGWYVGVLGLLAGTPVYWLMSSVLLPGRGLENGWGVFLILLAGLAATAGYRVIETALVMGGHPGAQTTQKVVVAAVNLGLCFSLCPLLGAEGAALAFTVSSLAGALATHVLVRRFLGVSL